MNEKNLQVLQDGKVAQLYLEVEIEVSQLHEATKFPIRIALQLNDTKPLMSALSPILNERIGTLEHDEKLGFNNLLALELIID